MPANTAAIQTFWIAGEATYNDCEISWNTASNTIIVYDPLHFTPPIIQKSFGSIQKVLHESVEPACLTIVMQTRWYPQEKVYKSLRLIFLFRDVSSAIDFHKILLPLNKDYVKIIAKCSCRESPGYQEIEPSPLTGNKRAHDEADDERSTKRYRPAFCTTLKIPSHLQPRLADILAKTPQPAAPIHKAQARIDDGEGEDTIIIASPLGPNRRHVRESAPSPLRRSSLTGRLLRRSIFLSPQPPLASSTTVSIPSPATTPELDSNTKKSLDEQFLANQQQIDALNHHQAMLWKARVDEHKKLIEDLKVTTVEEFVEVREENGKLELERTELQDKITGLQGQVAVAKAEQSLAATRVTQLQADIQLLKDLVGRITRPLVQLDVDGYLTRIKWGEDPDASIKASQL
ncbi:hypothetical protein LTR10_013508 [Elasticomyces elasticus]|uniref:Uncharacterized protein n=1 Tax=Exophiala sideris TaxID=1016849 RepID=A0ABR0JQ30_9EURO|nr:hypothetical protein LTR10_013508 [Elasticomyces elasticus]KAK5039645.1 hypothetical protein LTS07_000139 [Exophiala sideris]KAK5041197.1 hypothetical protein LTR13_002671 [Exophiala sideris]KAK5068022.1 hypothetical protein LTR69_000139 [Exophiala sideris]KAK5187324.1 hypothetical protein LTR44_000139 [Eurotiomycetes sp. CCFEE 6388]